MSASKGPEEVVARFTAAHQKNVEKAGPFLRNSVLGDVLAELLESGRNLSVENLIDIVQERIASSPSARGKLDIKDDIYRAPLVHALALLNSRLDA
jgi:hypothetical protein